MIKFVALVTLVGVVFADPIPTSFLRAPDGRIIGGKNTSIEEAPYQVSILIGNNHYCGGSIIAKNWVLTAAHCATKLPKQYNIRSGSSSSDNGGSIHRVSHVISHEKYFMDEYWVPSNDIALFKVSTPFVMTTTRKAIELYRKGEEAQVGVQAVITGWGTISPNFNMKPSVLQTVSVPIISKADCIAAYSYFTKVNPGQICAAYPRGGKDACQGDSGGPLVIGGRLAGVVSWGNGCAEAGHPGVYTEVAYFHDWINKTMKTSNASSALIPTSSLGIIILALIVHTVSTLEFLSQ